jgi:uncharacterized protein (DUF488 family)
MYTIGHSTRSIEEFIELLKINGIKLLADVRRFPGSRSYPQFSKEELKASLAENDIRYIHFEALGGRRKPLPGSANEVWKNLSFRGYADYMETPEFRKAIEELLSAGDEKHTAIMCSEAVWWRCHRSMIADYLKSIGIEVIHILSATKNEEHPYTKPARIVGGKLSYHEAGLF